MYRSTSGANPVTLVCEPTAESELLELPFILSSLFPIWMEVDRRRGRRRIRRRGICLCNFLIEFRRLFPIQWICRCGSKHLTGIDICGEREKLVTMVEFRFGRLRDGKEGDDIASVDDEVYGVSSSSLDIHIVEQKKGIASSLKVNVCLVLLVILQIEAKVKYNLLHVGYPGRVIGSNSGLARLAFCQHLIYYLYINRIYSCPLFPPWMSLLFALPN